MSTQDSGFVQKSRWVKPAYKTKFQNTKGGVNTGVLLYIQFQNSTYTGFITLPFNSQLNRKITRRIYKSTLL